MLFPDFADRSRLSMLEALAEGEHRFSDIVKTTWLTQPNASGHLAGLCECS